MKTTVTRTREGRVWESDTIHLSSTWRWQKIKYAPRRGDNYLMSPYVTYYGARYWLDEFIRGDFPEEQAMCGISLAGSFSLGIGAAILIHLEVHRERALLFYVRYKPKY